MALTRPKSGQINFDAHNVTDPLIRINSGQSGANDKDAGWVIERGSDTNVAFMWDESVDQFVLVNTTEDGTTSGNVTISSYANLQVGTINTATLEIGGTAVTSTATELNLLDGVTGTLVTEAGTQTLTNKTLDATTFTGDINLNDADDQIIHGDTSYNQKQYVLYGTTTNNTETEIFVGGTASSRIPVASNTTIFYDVNIVARRTDSTGESAGWHLKSVADNFSGTVADVGSVYEVAVATDDATWNVDCRADNTNDSVNVYCTGATGKTIRWTAVVRTFEVAQ